MKKRYLITMSLFGVLSAASLLGFAQPAHAGNSSVEATIQGYGDLSMFYQALLNTGVINELSEDQHYTIFAPTNAAFAQISQQTYPCFYMVECRPQIAAVLRNHIVADEHDLPNLISYGYGIDTLGGRHIHVEEPYVGQFTVDNRTILSKSIVGGNAIYRIDGVLVSPQELAQFRSAPYDTSAYAPPDSITTQRTVTRKVYSSTATPTAYPSGAMVITPPPGVQPDASQTTIITNTYTEQ